MHFLFQEFQGYKRSEKSDNLVYDYADSANTDQNSKVTPCKPMNRVVSSDDTPKIINSVSQKPSVKKNRAPDVPKTVSNTQVKIVDTLTKASKKSLFAEKTSSDFTEKLSQTKILKPETTNKPPSQPSSPQKVAPKPTKSTAIMTKTALFESKTSPRKDVDPALLSLQERLALFEKNKGVALTPKAPLAMAPNIKSLIQKDKGLYILFEIELFKLILLNKYTDF